jgi:hypothetical protein
MSDFSDTIARFATGRYTVTRTPARTYGGDGLVDPASPKTLTIEASVQPLRGRELERLPEGLRSSEVMQVFTTTELKTQSTSHEPDVIAIDGESWQVEIVERWKDLGNFYRAVVRKV